MSGRETSLKVLNGAGAVVGYGSLAGFLYVVLTQSYHWLRDGEWTHIGLSDGLRIGLYHCCVKDGDAGWLASFVHWLETPVEWLGLYRVLEVMPASLALFLLSILGNFLFIYCRDRLVEAGAAPTPTATMTTKG